MANKNQISKFDKFLKAVIFFSVFLVWGAVVFYRINFNGDLSSSSEEWAHFGDFYGGLLGPLLSFLSILILLWTLKNQENDLKVKQDEGTFFKMLDFLNRTIDNVEIRFRSGSLKSEARNGNSAINFIVRNLVDELDDLLEHDKLNKNELTKIFQEICKQYRSSLGSFFRLTENILIFIDQSSFDFKVKLQYVSILKSMLPQSHKLLIFYDGVVGKDKDHLKELLEKYEFFEFLESDDNGASQYFRSEYNQNAFGKNK